VNVPATGKRGVLICEMYFWSALSTVSIALASCCFAGGSIPFSDKQNGPSSEEHGFPDDAAAAKTMA
jgi:hypothetical protein